jgi:hypothetical protein
MFARGLESGPESALAGLNIAVETQGLNLPIFSPLTRRNQELALSMPPATGGTSRHISLSCLSAILPWTFGKMTHARQAISCLLDSLT